MSSGKLQKVFFEVWGITNHTFGSNFRNTVLASFQKKLKRSDSKISHSSEKANFSIFLVRKTNYIRNSANMLCIELLLRLYLMILEGNGSTTGPSR